MRISDKRAEELRDYGVPNLDATIRDLAADLVDARELIERNWEPADGFWIVSDDGRSKSRVADLPLAGVALNLAPYLDVMAEAICKQRDTPRNSAYDIALAVIAAIDEAVKGDGNAEA